MLDITFLTIQRYLDECTCQVSSPYKVFNLVAVANMSKKNISEFIFECHLNHPSRKWKILTKDAGDNFDYTGKKSFPYL